MFLKKIILAIGLFAGLSITALAQTPAIGCPVGQGILTTLANVGLGCGPSVLPIGSYVQMLGQTAAIAAQTICDTSATCPAGFYALHLYMRTATTGTIVSAVTGNITFTDDVGNTTQALGVAMSLLNTTPFQATYNFYHAANTAVTVNTTATALTGSPTYNFRARLIYLGS